MQTLTLDWVNFRPWAVEMTTVRSLGAMTPRSRNLIRAASATPVWGQLNMPAPQDQSQLATAARWCVAPGLKRMLMWAWSRAILGKVVRHA